MFSICYATILAYFSAQRIIVQFFQLCIKVTRNMVYNYEDHSEIPDLDTFTDELIEDILCSAFFQHKSDKKYDMLKLPVLMAPCLFRQKVNSEHLKKTIMEKEFEYADDTVNAFHELVETKAINLSKIKDMTVKKLEEVGDKLGLLKKKVRNY